MKDVIHILELSEKIGLSVDSIRGHMKRRTNAVPPWFYQGRLVAWRRKTVEEWLEDQEEEAIRERVVRPARRRLGGSSPSAS